MCISKPYKKTDQKFFYKDVKRDVYGEMISPVAHTKLYIHIGEWQHIGFFKALRQINKIKRGTSICWNQLGKLFVGRDPHRASFYHREGETWLVESKNINTTYEYNTAVLGTFRFLGQVIDDSWNPKETAKEKRSIAAKKGWEKRRKKT